MAKRVITVDDLTDAEIEGKSFDITLTLSVDGQEEISGEYEISEFTLKSIQYLVDGNLPEFISRMRPLFKDVKSADQSEIVRKWAKAAHPEMKISERGRLGAEVFAAYKREVTDKVNAPDNSQVIPEVKGQAIPEDTPETPEPESPVIPEEIPETPEKPNNNRGRRA